MIEGTKEVVLTFRFALPPGVDEDAIVQMLAQGGVSVAVGLLGYVRSIAHEVRLVGPQLST